MRLFVILNFFIILNLYATPSRKNVHFSKYNIALIHSYQKGLWTNEALKGVKEGFHHYEINSNVIEYEYDYVSVGTNAKKKKESMDKIIKSIIKLKANFIIIFDDEASDALVSKLIPLNIPIVLTGINQNEDNISWLDELKKSTLMSSIILERYPFEQSLKMLKEIKPSVKEISILSSENFTSKLTSSQIIKQFKKFNNVYNGINFKNTFLSSSWQEWRKIINEYKGEDKALWILVPWNVNDINGKEVDLRKIGDYYRENSKLPSLGIVNINQQLGFLASFSVSAQDLGYQAAQTISGFIKNNRKYKFPLMQTNKTIRFIINKKRADQLKLKIPKSFLEFATIEKKIPMKYQR